MDEPYSQALLGNIENRFNQGTESSNKFYTDKENNNEIEGDIGISFSKKFE